MPPARLLTAVTASLVALTACGTTTPLTTQQTLGQGAATTGGGELTAGTTGAAGPTGTLAGSTGGAVATGTSGGTSGGTSYGGSSGTGGTGTSGTGAGGTTGATAVGGARDTTPVRVGFELIQGGNAAIGAAFGTPVNFGDGKREVTAIVNDVNARGGINGRKVLPFFANWNVADGDAGRDKSCKSLVQDSKVQFIVTVINITTSFLACAAKAGVPVVNASFGAGDTELYRTYGDYFYSPSLMNLNREEEVLINALVGTGVLSPSMKTGVVIDGTGDPQYQRVYKTTVDPLLSAKGITHESFVVATQSDVSSAILRFSADGVQNVIFVAPSGVIEVLFMQAAEQQQYRPKYGMGDSTSVWFVSSAAPENQVKQISGVGSLPISNVEVAQYPTTPREAQCLKLIAAAGESNADRHSSITATVYCEAIRAFVAVGEKVTGKLTAASFKAAYPTVGKGYAPVTTFSTDFANGRHDNASTYRLMAYQAGCACIAYTSPGRAL